MEAKGQNPLQCLSYPKAIPEKVIKMLGATDLPTLLITAVVFLAGFSSLRLHATFMSKRKTLDDIVSAVTSYPGFADRLRHIDQDIARAGNSGLDWRRQAAKLRKVEDPALTDRDLVAARAHFEPLPKWHRWRKLDDIATLTFVVVVLILLCLLALIIYDKLSGNDIAAATIALAIGCVVLAVTWLDMHSVANEYEEIADGLRLRGPTASLWCSEGAGVRPFLRGSLDRFHDTVVPDQSGDGVLERTARLFPEWSTPHALLAYSQREQTHFRASAEGHFPEQRGDVAEGLHHALQAVELNPFDPGGRILLAALTIDALCMDYRDAGNSGTLGVLYAPLPLSDVSREIGDADERYAERWRFAQALRRAREASIVVERRWGKVAGNRSAAGRLTDLDRIAVNYQMGRAYVLSAWGSPGPKARKNADLGRDWLHRTQTDLTELAGLTAPPDPLLGSRTHSADHRLDQAALRGW